ncbi:MAG: arylesterase, partial [Acidobacteriota bacterium]|nr:arylesterase [Acidobacteriota bacterium]
GLKLPPNLGSDYVHRFEAIYPRLADELDVALVPFMLDGVAGVAELNFPDGIHPTAEGHRRVAETVLPWVEKALSETASPE